MCGRVTPAGVFQTHVVCFSCGFARAAVLRQVAVFAQNKLCRFFGGWNLQKPGMKKWHKGFLMSVFQDVGICWSRQ